MVIGCEPIPITVIKLLFRLFVCGFSFGYRGSVRKMRIYNAKEMSPIKKADFHLKESTFLVILIQLKHPLVHLGTVP